MIEYVKDDVTPKTLYDVAILYGHTAMKSALYLNAGVAFAVLIFLLVNSSEPPLITSMYSIPNYPTYLNCFLLYVIGITSAVSSIGIAYISQVGYYMTSIKPTKLNDFNKVCKRSGILRNLSIGLVVLSYLIFTITSILLYYALQTTH